MKFKLIILNILFIILISSISEALKVTKIDRYAGIDYKPVEQLYCSIGEKVIKFESKNQYKTFGVKLFSPKGNVIIRIDCPKQIMCKPIIKIIRGEEVRINIKTISFNGEVEILFYDYITKEFVLKLIVKGELTKSYLKQRTTISQSTTNNRLNHSIRYKDWGINVSGSQYRKSNEFHYNFSVSKQW